MLMPQIGAYTVSTANTRINALDKPSAGSLRKHGARQLR